ncbi:MAG: trigger factor [Rhodobacteraceae bacterium]|nr:trigger factor [Paracoccaceae bacterium]
MQVTETLNEGLKRGYSLTVTAAELDARVQAKLAQARPRAEMKGFRRGKVPMALLRRQLGPSILGEALQESIDGAVNDHFERSGDSPALQPEISMAKGDWKEGDDIEIALRYECLPEVPEPDFSTLHIEKLTTGVEDRDVEESLARLARSTPVFEDRGTDAAARKGDKVVISFNASVAGKPFEGSSAENYPLVLGAGSFIPGLEEQLAGMKTGEQKEVHVTFPETHGNKALAGKAAVFACTVQAVQAPRAAETDDDLARQFGAESLDALKDRLRDSLKAEYGSAARLVMKRALMDKLAELADFELPPTMVENEARSIAVQLWQEEHPGADPAEREAERENVTPSDETVGLAERRVRLGLLLAAVGQRQNIQVTEDEMQRAAIQQARQHPGQERRFLDLLQNNEQLQHQLRLPILEDKVVDYILELADVTEKPVSRDELQKAVEALDDARGENRD